MKKKKIPANLRKLLEWLDGDSPLLEAQIVAAGMSHTLDKALMRNFAEMNLREARVSITARGRDALTRLPTSPRISDGGTVAHAGFFILSQSRASAQSDRASALPTMPLRAQPRRSCSNTVNGLASVS
jgi:hypothetical protein